MNITNYKLGVISGFIFGLFSLLFVFFGLASIVAEIIGKIFIFPGITFGKIFYNSILVAFLFNGFIYAFIGFLIQHLLKKGNKNEKIVVYIFLAIAILCILSIIVEGIIYGGFTA